MTVTCPNCGSEIPVPNRKKKSIQCPYCDMGGLEFDLDYFDEESNQPVLNFSIHVPPKPSKQLDTLLWQQCLLSEALNLQKIELPN